LPDQKVNAQNKITGLLDYSSNSPEDFTYQISRPQAKTQASSHSSLAHVVPGPLGVQPLQSS
jgi:hypothetical protein